MKPPFACAALVAAALLADPAAANNAAFVGPLDKEIRLDPAPPGATRLNFRVLFARTNVRYGVEYLGQVPAAFSTRMHVRGIFSAGTERLARVSASMDGLHVACTGFDGVRDFGGASGETRSQTVLRGPGKWFTHQGTPTVVRVNRSWGAQSGASPCDFDTAPEMSFLVEWFWS